MQIWIYGNNPEQIRDMIEKNVKPGDTVAGTSVCAEIGSTFSQSGLIPAISAAIRGEIDLLLVPTFHLLGGKGKTAQMVELFQNYGVSVRSVSSSGINSS